MKKPNVLLTKQEIGVLIIHEITTKPSPDNICTLMRVCFSQHLHVDEVSAICMKLERSGYLEHSNEPAQAYKIATKGKDVASYARQAIYGRNRFSYSIDTLSLAA